MSNKGFKELNKFYTKNRKEKANLLQLERLLQK